jgi:hypothetical protein
MGHLIVFLGGGFGSAARHGMNVLSAHYLGTRYPLGTFCIHVLGSLLIGILAEYFAVKANLPVNTRLFLITGILGGFTNVLRILVRDRAPVRTWRSSRRYNVCRRISGMRSDRDVCRNGTDTTPRTDLTAFFGVQLTRLQTFLPDCPGSF